MQNNKFNMAALPDTMETKVISSPQIDKIAAALAKAQGMVKEVIKSEEGEVKGTSKASGKDYSYKYNYAGLDAVMDAIREAFSSNGLAIFQRFPAGKAAMHVMLLHESGQWLDYGLYSLGTVNTHQEKGGAITYGRRYMVQCIAGVAPKGEDDDADKANDTLGREPKHQPKGAGKAEHYSEIDLGPPSDFPGDDSGPARAPGQPQSDKEKRAGYQAAKDEYKVADRITLDGKIDWDDFAACMEFMIPNVKNLSEMSMLTKANGKRLNEMEVQRPDLHKHISDMLHEKGQPLL